MVVLEKMKVKGNIIIGILVFSVIAWGTGLAKFNGVVGSIPPMTYLFDFDLKAALTAGMSTVVFTLLFIEREHFIIFWVSTTHFLLDDYYS